jgi:hypothetical protein
MFDIPSPLIIKVASAAIAVVRHFGKKCTATGVNGNVGN